MDVRRLWLPSSTWGREELVLVRFLMRARRFRPRREVALSVLPLLLLAVVDRCNMDEVLLAREADGSPIGSGVNGDGVGKN